MPNPCGPYPGRQLFLGVTRESNPFMVYLVTGRSLESRQRKALKIDNTVRIGPLGDVPYDPLRHYNAVKYDDISGVLAVSNGIQTEALYETYRLLFNVNASPGEEFMKLIMEGAGAEPDSLHTPRIAGVIVPGKVKPAFIMGIKNFNSSAAVYRVNPVAGNMMGISTYTGSLETPVPTPGDTALPMVEFKGKTAEDAAAYVYDMSAASYKGEDIRVCAVGCVFMGNRWDVAIINKYA